MQCSCAAGCPRILFVHPVNCVYCLQLTVPHPVQQWEMALSVGASLIVSMYGVESCLVADVSVRPG
jgi:hypothetical protein